MTICFREYENFYMKVRFLILILILILFLIMIMMKMREFQAGMRKRIGKRKEC